jgi:hypothetical protein
MDKKMCWLVNSPKYTADTQREILLKEKIFLEIL